MDKSELTTLFRESFPFWDRISESDRESFLRTSHHVKFEKGNTIHTGEECTGVILIKSGSLRIYLLSDEGKEITLYRLYPGDICMLSASCVLDAITFDVFVDAEELSECVVVGGCAYEEISLRIPEVKIFALEVALSRFSDVMWVLQQVLFMSMDKRLAIFLVDEMSKNGGNSIISLTHEQIAKYMASAREVVSRMLKYFATEGIVEVSRGGIRVLDKKRLVALTR